MAEWLVSTGENALGFLMTVGNRILQLASERLSGNKEQLAHAEGLLPVAACNALERAGARLRNAAIALSGISGRRLHPQLTRLDMTLQAVKEATRNRLQRANSRLDAAASLLDALSPMATLKRGYTITRIDGHAVTSASQLQPGAIIETIFPDGTAISEIKTVTNKS